MSAVCSSIAAAISNNSTDVTDSVCVVCFKPIEIYSIGDCDHPVCFECSTRMRVLCLQTECPICRHDISKVIFTYKVEPYKSALNKANSIKKSLCDEKYKILFADCPIKDAYLQLLEHNCKKCRTIFKTFGFLKDHMMKEHDYFFCNLCVDNLKIFTTERKFYTRKQLEFHQKKGDPDDTSHKGHPLCQFCNTRYMDTDELFRHLRRDHLYCHLCDADGFHQYYVSFQALRDHFGKDHYLCDEGDCCSEGNMTVFRTDVDYKAHKASEHGRGLSKHAARQARTLEVQFTLAPRPLPSRQHHRADRSEGENARAESCREALFNVPQSVETMPVVDTDSIEQFPTLGECGSTSGIVVPLSRQDKHIIRQTTGALARTDENFPALSPSNTPGPSTSFRVNISHPGPSSAVIRTSVKPNVCIQVHNPNGHYGKRHPTSLEEDSKIFLQEFPTLTKKDRSLLVNDYTSYAHSSNNALKKVPVANNNEVKTQVSLVEKQQGPPPPSLDAFPSLHPPTSSSPSTLHALGMPRPQWIAKVKTKESVSKQSNDRANGRVQPPPPKPFVNDISQFPAPPPPSGNVPWASKTKSNVITQINSGQSQWVTAKQRDSIPKGSKVAPAPQIPSTELNISQFPLLRNKPKGKQLREEVDVNANKTTLTKRKDKSKRNTESNTEVTQKPKAANKEIDKTNKSMQEEPKALKLNDSLPDFSPRRMGSKKQTGTPACNGFTFTSSSGQHYEIPAHSYIQPINFNERNKFLVTKFLEILGEADAIHEFKLYSQLFREGRYSAECYYNHCVEAMKDGFREMFPELLVLLPDIRKQQELYNIHLSSSVCMSPLHVCDICGQILVIQDVQLHKDFHAMQSAFPALGPPPSTLGNK